MNIRSESGRCAVLIDRDGTMGGKYYVKRPQEYAPYPGTRKAFLILCNEKIPAYIVTNQSCIARGFDGGYDFAAEFRDIGATDWFICPHDDEDGCSCRKPGTGLIEQARDRHHLDLSCCYMIGDRWTDMLAGGRMNMKLVLVQTGHGKESLGLERSKWADYIPAYVAVDLLDAVKWLVKQEKLNKKSYSDEGSTQSCYLLGQRISRTVFCCSSLLTLFAIPSSIDNIFWELTTTS